MFPNHSKIASVFPLVKNADDKYYMANFRSANVLKSFLKINERLLERAII